MSKDKLQIVFASAEAAPFVKTGGLGDVAGSLPQALVKAGADVIVLVPLYSTIPDVFKNRMQHVGEFYVSLGWRNEYCGMERLDVDGVTYLFLDNKRYFDRSYPYGFFDDGERFAFFSKAVTESLQHLPDGFECDVLHCNDWHTALAPVFLREFYQGLPLYERVKTVFTIHNIAFQGQFSDTILNDVLGLAHIPAAAGQLRCDSSSINYMQGALNYTDAITTVSPTYAWEIQTSDFGERLDGILRRRNNILTGILNGIDEPSWDPRTDVKIPANYGVGSMEGKAACKRALQQELGLEVRDDRPLMVMVTRLTRQKGLDLVTYSLDRILSGGVQVAVLGTGDRAYEDALNHFARTYPGTMATRITFDSDLSRRMYAGADMFLMPSLFEPCGLSQIIAMRYGTLPIVRETGGLRDTVQPYNYVTGEGTGFSFAHFNGDEMGDAVFRAARLFWDNRDAWNGVVERAMRQDFSWTRSAAQYLDLYHGLHPEIPLPVVVEEPAPTEAAEEPTPAEDAAAQDAPEAEELETPKPNAAPAQPAAEPAVAPEPEAEEPATEPAAATEEAAEEPAPAAKTTKPRATKAASTASATTSTRKRTTTKKATAKATSATKTTKAAASATATEAAAEDAAEETTTKPAAKATKPATKTSAKTAAKPKATSTSAAKKTAATKTTATKTTSAKKTTTTKATTAKKTTKATASATEAPAEKSAQATTTSKAAPKAAAKSAAPKSASRAKASAASTDTSSAADTATPKSASSSAPKATAADEASTTAKKPATKTSKTVPAARKRRS